MPLQADVSRSAAALSQAIINTTRTVPIGKLYEEWLILEIGVTFRRMGHACVWRDWNYDIGGHPTGIAIFRGSPSGMKSAQTRQVSPGYMELVVNNKKYEIHNSLQYTGVSGVRHELDISILPAPIGRKIRRRINGGFPRGSPRASLELKKYSGKTSFSIGLMRGIIATSIDLSLRRNRPVHDIWYNGLTGNAGGNVSKTYWGAITTTQNIGNSSILGQYYKIHLWNMFRINPNILPGQHPGVLALCASMRRKLV